MNYINLNSSQKTHMEMDFINKDRKKNPSVMVC